MMQEYAVIKSSSTRPAKVVEDAKEVSGYCIDQKDCAESVLVVRPSAKNIFSTRPKTTMFVWKLTNVHESYAAEAKRSRNG